MSEPWLSIIGLNEDGLPGLGAASRKALEDARIVFGGPRHLALAGVGGRGREWPVPFDLAPILALRGERVAMLTSGDPFWFGAGGSIAAHLDPSEWRVFPVAGVFSLAAARMGWRLEDCATLGLHAAPFAQIRPHLHRGCRIIATLRDGGAPAALAEWLRDMGANAARLTVLERLGGPRERIGPLRDDHGAPVAVAIDGCDLPAGFGLTMAAGRSDDLFDHRGQITKSPIRAMTLAALAPRPGELLWDIGGGSGSISVEWALAGGRAICIEPREDRLDLIRSNRDRFGVAHRIEVVQGTAPDALRDLPGPDAIFVGGGGGAELFDAILPLPVRIVANAVTLETESLLATLHARHGGSLTRIAISEAAPLGGMRGWQPARPVTQWTRPA
ncbi:precorrin-6y C5,15-methyltransferase (decarboxylating) subunit CbiE [Paracoccus sp. 1_MG-2023]|uniref:precorrin-6y C5,15-methyltransferase (decarboxylating) subunit CbiE n=1 Tax=unclassified Paracoccus (in: a-proteobacteria) TaxID=2688777 RepID=UPI001C09BC2B|nr:MULTISPECIES: precorrin-6y C5,15-methyltransferase (decarboxylating) subunit CbiE [unclassified Paracoccus (in: a-proteobacteria)]MBU2956194.1 precorrin-6y C5,15-methyltransferase (decarboxylating) subunit CbiE [Paracoccus sp. C2R09]MDO6667871.1 precorrin-6y C5,15-methyltransferase (decarboxylating) subunit CbiE [Paracoccus sp. 1_MG-2023]